jgi:hypothetical protein
VIDEPLAVVAKLAMVLDKLRVPYAVGGSVASSLHGVPRATNDVDLVADLRPAHVDRLVAALESDFYVDADMIRSALTERSSFNVLDQVTMTKVDVFVPGADLWIIEELVRARAETIDVQGQPTAIRFATPEDTMLYKLVWYRLGGEQSERQWNDVLGIIKVQADRLDRAYLRQWAKYLKVTDLLDDALRA